MKTGLIAYSTDTGLGNQTFEFYKHMSPAKTLVVDIKQLNGMPTHHERFTDGEIRIVKGIPRKDDIDWLLTDIEAVFLCETPLNYELYDEAKRRRVATIQAYNYEFLDYIRKPNLPAPTLFAAPTTWYLPEVVDLNIAPVKVLRVPVNRGRIKFRTIKKCETFTHTAGRITYKDRNGTRAFIEAAKQLPQFNYKMYIQKPTEQHLQKEYEELLQLARMANIMLVIDLENYEDLYKTGDVLVLPRKYGGLCLPMNEALSAGMPVVMTDIVPNQELLPKEWLCATRAAESFNFHAPVQTYESELKSLVDTMSRFSDDEFMQNANQLADQLASAISWETLKPEYSKAFEGVHAYNCDR